MRFFHCLLFAACVFASNVGRCAPVISEFMASNKHAIYDEDGDASDWLEIRNPDSLPVNMNGWFLTDTATNLKEWMFPAVTIPAKGHLLVWCSSKDRRIVGSPLHTNFDLKASGEYLALVAPDGSTRSTEFTPAFPAQYTDVSYGTSLTTTNVTLVAPTAAVRAFVPADNSLGTAWRARAFSDASWLSGAFPVGFMNYGKASSPDLQSTLSLDFKTSYPAILGSGRNAFLRTHFTVSNPSAVARLTLSMNYDDGFYAWLNGSTAAGSPGAPAEGALVYNSFAPDHSPGSFESYDVSSQIPSLVAGDNVLALDVLNANASSSDLYAVPQLVAGVETGAAEVTGYFSAATPGQPNGGPETVVLPQTVTASRASGTFSASFSLTLTGAVSGQQIRYVLVDPTSTTGANVADPTLSSTLYSGAITVSSSKILRAAVFNPTNGQKGATLTVQYLLLETATTNNTSNFTSTMPILVADDHGAGQPIDSNATTFPASAADTKTAALFYVFDVNATSGLASLTATPTTFTRAGMVVRGKSSQNFPKKSYGLEVRDEKNNDAKLSLLGMGSDSDWVLNGPWTYDDTFFHNAFVYELSRQLGHWAPRTRFAEMFTNSNGGKLDYADYAGIYVLNEKIGSGSNRLDITSIKPSDNAGSDLTGGYIFKIDPPDADENYWVTSHNVPSNTADGVKLIVVEPKSSKATSTQVGYLINYVQTFENTLYNEKSAGYPTRNYRSYIDTPSWIDYHIMNALAFNVDGLRLSAYFYKDRDGKIIAGPTWDYDRSLGSDDGRDANPRTWNNISYYFTLDWWGQLFQDADFVQNWVDRWWQLRQSTLSNANLNAIADTMGAQISQAADTRDATKWPDNAAAGGVYQNEVNALKTWLTSTTAGSLGRAAWIDSQLPAAPTASLASGIVNPGTTVSLGATGTVRYTVDGSDPRLPGGIASSAGLSYGGPIAINQTTVVTARQQGNFTPFPGAVSTGWGGITTRVYLVNESFAAAGDLAVSEVNYAPLAPSAAESALVPSATASDFEFIELRNVGARKVNTFEVRFPQGFPFADLKLSPLSLAPGDSALVVKNRAAFAARYGSAPASRIIGEWGTGSLSNSGETITILGRDGTTIQSFTYGSGAGWPARANGLGSTLEYVGTAFDDASYNVPANWRASSEIHGSPGALGAGPDTRLVINEILSHSNTPRVDAIELYNPGASSLDISNWLLGDAKTPESADDYVQYRIPAGTVVPAYGYKVFTEADFNPNGSWNQNAGTPGAGEFAFDAHHGDRAWVIQTDANSNPGKFVDDYSFGGTASDESLGRWPNGSGNFYPMRQRTLLNENTSVYPRPGLGAANSAPRVGPLILNEIHHSPPSGNTDLEFVEIRNAGSATQALAHWQLTGSVTYSFADADSLAANALLVVVPFSPTDATKAAAFRAAYGIGTSVTLAGPWSKGDHLGVTGQLTLYRADSPSPDEPNFYPLLTEDQSAYASALPWPNAANGFSLNRRGTTIVGDFAGTWKTDVPSPGTLGPTYAQWQALYFPGGGAGTGGNEDYDGDGVSNAQEYAAGTNPRISDAVPPFALSIASPAATGNGGYNFSYTIPVDRPGAQYKAQESFNLLDWNDIASMLASTNQDTQTYVITVPADSGKPTVFFRLRINLSTQ